MPVTAAFASLVQWEPRRSQFVEALPVAWAMLALCRAVPLDPYLLHTLPVLFYSDG
jgi:hypothetical protein